MALRQWGHEYIGGMRCLPQTMFAEIAGDPANDMALFHAGNPIRSPVDGMWAIRLIIQNPYILCASVSVGSEQRLFSTSQRSPSRANTRPEPGQCIARPGCFCVKKEEKSSVQRSHASIFPQKSHKPKPTRLCPPSFSLLTRETCRCNAHSARS